MIFSIVLLLVFAPSQIYWAWRGYRFASPRISSRTLFWAFCAIALAVYFVEYQFTMGAWRERQTPVRLTATDAFLVAPFLWWAASSMFAFLVVLILATFRGVASGVHWLIKRKPERETEVRSPERRQLLEHAATAAVAAPFIGGAYGLLYGRLNLEVTQQTIRLPKLPRAFEGFRICQLSDIHIGPFMPAAPEYVAIANSQKAEMVVLTGDFVTFDPNTQEPVVDALRGLRAPYGVFGSLGNHDAWAGVEDSITELFRQAGVRILRGSNIPIEAHGESFNLLGVDFQSSRRFGASPATPNLLGDIAPLVDHGRVNILLSHNPDTFDKAASLGIDLSLAGHTHGGQASLEFISPELAPNRFVTPYVAGWFQQPGGQLYVNRGIGTIFIPIRLGAPPEITVYHLTRG